VIKGRVKAILEYITTVQEFMNFDGYLALGWTQELLLEIKNDPETQELLALNYKILSNQYKKITADPGVRFMIELIFKHPVHYQKPNLPNLTPGPGHGHVPGERKDSGPLIQYCLEELGRRGCDSSTFCRQTLLNMDTTMYTITHQVMYFYFLIKMDCPGKLQFQATTFSMCKKIHQEALKFQKTIRAGQAPEHCYVDLFLEQIAFCGGLLDYRSFLDSKVLDTVLTISSKVCVERTVKVCHHNETMQTRGYPPPEYLKRMKIYEQISKNSLRRQKRADVELPGGCSLHATGLMVTVLAKFLALFSQ